MEDPPRCCLGLGAIRTMKAWQAWREAVKLFWQRPVLSLPVLVAAIIPFVLEGVDSLWKRLLLPPPIAAYSVNPPFSQLLVQSANDYWNAYWPILMGNLFVQVGICVTALFVTAGAVRRLKSEEPTSLLRHGMMFARSRWRAVMWMSLAGSGLFALYEAARFIVFYLSVTDLMDRALNHGSAWRIGISVLYTLLYCIGAWILTEWRWGVLGRMIRRILRVAKCSAGSGLQS